jgi:hypothetical protein
LAYRYRNRELRKRYVRMVARGLLRLMREDLRNLLRLKIPLLTFAIPFYGLKAYFLYRRGQLTVSRFEDHVANVFLHRDFQHPPQGRPVVFAVTRILSLARDIDTRKELEEVC